MHSSDHFCYWCGKLRYCHIINSQRTWSRTKPANKQFQLKRFTYKQLKTHIMKTSVKVLGFAVASALLTSCGSSKVANFLEAFTPEESGLNLVKLTDESTNSIISGNATKEPSWANRAYYKNSSWAYSAESHFKWCPLRTLARRKQVGIPIQG